MTTPSKHKSAAQQELDKAETASNQFESSVKEMTLDRMNMAPKEEVEPQTKIAQSDLNKKKDIYLKPKKTIGSQEKFNEKYRADYDFAKEYVNFTAEHKEIIGEVIELWTKPFAGMPAEFWEIPSNVPLWAPRYVAERLKGCSYHRLTMKQGVSTGYDTNGNQYYGTMAVDGIIQRLDAIPVSSRRSVFMGAGF